MNNSVLVSILMPTYNHERYIVQAIESALAQKTDYQYELLINDDCSTDGTRGLAQSFVDKFPDKVKLMYPEKNQGLIRSYKRLLDVAQGKYIAILESDDVWIDRCKLQKQIDFLERNPEYGLCATACVNIDANDTILATRDEIKYDGIEYWYEMLIENNSLAAVTVCFSKAAFNSFCDLESYVENDFKIFDYPVWLSISKHMKCHHFHDITAGYRVLTTSISNVADYKKSKKWEDECTKILLFITQKYGFGSLSEQDFKFIVNEKYLRRAVLYKNFYDYIYYSHRIKGRGIKRFFQKFFPILYFLQRKLRGLDV